MSIREHLDKALDKLLIALLPPPPPDDCEYCPHCGGSGIDGHWVPCPSCQGVGYVLKKRKVKHV